MSQPLRKHRPVPDASRLAELREAHGLTQQECADALGIGQPSYAKMESGQTPLRRRDRVTLAVRYGLSLSAAFPDAEAAAGRAA
jgi:transcriptional regulator with XRE-family HTH domain